MLQRFHLLLPHCQHSLSGIHLLKVIFSIVLQIHSQSALLWSQCWSRCFSGILIFLWSLLDILPIWYLERAKLRAEFCWSRETQSTFTLWLSLQVCGFPLCRTCTLLWPWVRCRVYFLNRPQKQFSSSSDLFLRWICSPVLYYHTLRLLLLENSAVVVSLSLLPPQPHSYSPSPHGLTLLSLVINLQPPVSWVLSLGFIPSKLKAHCSLFHLYQHLLVVPLSMQTESFIILYFSGFFSL